MTNPIDWTRPLRVVGTHEPVKVFEIEPCLERPIRVGWVRKDRAASNSVSSSDVVIKWVDRAGSAGAAKDDPLAQLAVENIPPEPRIVERWVVVRPEEEGEYRILSGYAQIFRPAVEALHCSARIARVLIEEPGE